jgi:hypothetical protein
MSEAKRSGTKGKPDLQATISAMKTFNTFTTVSWVAFIP